MDILNKKVTGNLYKGETWGFFLDKIFDHFLLEFIYPIKCTPQTNLLFDAAIEKFGYGGGLFDQPNNLFNLIEKYNKTTCTLSICIKNKGRKFETRLPKEISDLLVERIKLA